MDRRTFVAALAAACLPAPAGALAEQPQDVVLIVIDDPDYRWTLEHMPHTRRALCDHGCEFVYAFDDFSSCSPGRATLLTGQTAAHHGVIGENPPKGGWDVFDPKADDTVLTWAKAAGRRVGFFGHVMNGYREASRVLPGVDRCELFCDEHAPFKYWGPKTKNEKGAFTQWKNDDYSTTILRDQACDFIAQTPADQNLLLVVSTVAMHGSSDDPNCPDPDTAYAHAYDGVEMPVIPNANGPVKGKPKATVGLLQPYPVDAANHEWEMRRAAGRSVDDLVLAVINQLKASGRWRRANVVVTGDNGMSLDSHRYRGKELTYEEANRVPLAWRTPEGPSTGQRRFEFVSNPDVVATLVDIMGLAPTIALDGMSLRPILQGRSPDWRHQVTMRNNLTWALRTDDGWYYAETVTPEFGLETELIDMAGQLGDTDPFQNRNVVDRPEYAGVAASLRTRLAAARAA